MNQIFQALGCLTLGALVGCGLLGCGTDRSGSATLPARTAATSTADGADGEFVKTDAEWKEILTPQQFRVARQKGTEPAFTGKYWDNEESGTYACICCDLSLYSSETKFKSGTGWPSYWAPVSEEAVTLEVDRSHGMVREELLCSRCGAHLGHRFSDGPRPTGERHCINSASLRFHPGPKE